MPPDVKSIRIDRAVFQQTIEKKLADLPPLPAVVTQVIETINNPNTSAEELNRLISTDQGLSSKMLRIVNSSYYGFPKKISTLTQAVVILGYNTVRNLVLGVSAFGMLGQKAMPYGLKREDFWAHSVATAAGAQLIAAKKAPRARNVAEEAFIGGLLHDLGVLFMDSYFPVQHAVAMAFASREKKTTCEAEMMVLGIDHALVGRRVAEFWNFPPHLIAMISSHHEPVRSPDHFDICAMVQAGDWLSWQCGYVSSEHCQPPNMTEDVKSWLNWSSSDIEQFKIDLREKFAASAALLKIASE